MRSTTNLFIKLTFLLIIGISSSIIAFGQPVWQAGTPNAAAPADPMKPYQIDLNLNLDVASTIYYIVINWNYLPDVTPQQVKDAAIAGPSGGRVATGVLNYSGGDVGTTITENITGLEHNHLFSIFVVAEDIATTTLQADDIKLLATTNPCPPISVLKTTTQAIVCNPSNATFTAMALPPSGILTGTEWNIDWGTGIPADNPPTFISASQDDVPDGDDMGFRTFTYNNPAECNYVAVVTIENTCGENDNASTVLVAHDWDDRMDGVLDIVDDATGTKISPTVAVEVCEGIESVVTLRDNSTWNCQNPTVPDPLTPKPNSGYDRYINWAYGVDGTNTITGAVEIGVGDFAPFTDTPYPTQSSTTTTETITIPATCLEGEKFTVTVQNWNKCNQYPANSPREFTIEIEVISTPTATMQADFSICEADIAGTTITLTASGGGGGGNFDWTVVGPGGTDVYTNEPSPFVLDVSVDLSVGANTFELTNIQASSGNGCILTGSPIDATVVTVVTVPNKPTIDVTGDLEFCWDGGITSVTLTADVTTPPAVTSYQWYKDAVEMTDSIAVSIILSDSTVTGSYTVSALGEAPTNCLGPQSDPVDVIAHSLSNLTHPVPATVCENEIAMQTGNGRKVQTGVTLSLLSATPLLTQDSTQIHLP
jgi:hypothetical protein